LGKKVWYKVVDSVYIKLNPIIDQLSRATSSRKALQSATPDADTANRRLLGNHPTTNLPVYALKSRKGFLICESNPDKEKSRFANFTGNFAGITLEQAVALLVFPRNLGQFRDGDVMLKKAKNIYIAYGGTNYSIDSYMKANPDNFIEPECLTLIQAQEIILYYEESNKAKVENAKKDRKLNDDVVIKVGPFGPYIKYKNEVNIPLPKALKTQWETITLEQCQPVIEKNANRKPRGGAKAKPVPKAKAKPKKTSNASTEAVTTPVVKQRKPRVKKLLE
jgi:topoisomerase IA-like protein